MSEEQHHDAALLAGALSGVEPLVLLESVSIALVGVAASIELAREQMAGALQPIAPVLARRRGEIAALLERPDLHLGADERVLLCKEHDRLSAILQATSQ